MTRLLAIARKEALHVRRDRRSLIAALGLPVILILLYGFAVDFDLHHLPFAVVDQDRTPTSRRIVESVRSVHGFQLRAILDRADDADGWFEARAGRLVVVIPPGFERELKARRQATMQVVVDGAEGSMAAMTMAYGMGAVEHASRTVVRRELRALAVPLEALEPGLEVRVRVLYNPDLASRQFLVPGLVGLILMMLAALLTSGVVVRERELGSFELLAASPVSAGELIVGKLLPYLLLACFDVIMSVAVGWIVFGVVPKGDLLLLFGFSFVYMLAALALGLLFSCLARTQQTAMLMAIVATVVPTTLLSGFAFPIRNMPPLLRGLAQLLPATHFIDIARAIVLKGVGVSYFLPRAVALAVLSLLLLTLAVKRFRKTL